MRENAEKYLEPKKYFIEFRDRELKDREVKTKREMKEIFFKSIKVSIDNMDKFEQN